MKRTVNPISVGAIALLAALLSLQADDRKAGELIQAGRNEETVGNLKRAFELYEQAVQEAGNSRSLASKAMLQLGMGYQRTDRKTAASIFDRVVSKYPEQPAAIEARNRASAIRESLSLENSMTGDRALKTRTLWHDLRPGTDVNATSDGRHLIYVDPGPAGGLMIRDLVSIPGRVLVNSTGKELRSPVISRDSRQVAYSRRKSDGSYELKVVNTDGTHDRVVRGDNDVSYQPRDWSPDGRILTELERKDRGTLQVGFVDPSTGSFKALTTFGSREPGHLALSFDGRYLAFDFPQDEIGSARDVFVANIENFQERRIAGDPANDSVLGWTPDGKWLLFLSDRSGSPEMWAADTSGGNGAARSPLPLDGIGDVRPLGTTRSGALVYTAGSRNPEVRIAEYIPAELARLLLAALQQPLPPRELSAASVEGIVVKFGTNEPIFGAEVKLTRIEGTTLYPLSPGFAEGYAALFARPMTQRPPNGSNGLRTAESVRDAGLRALESQEIMTGDDGRFVFRNLKPGTYQLVSVQRQTGAFSGAQYGQRDPRGPGVKFPIVEGQTLRNARLEMAPMGVIAGHVFDDNGEPMGHAKVFALKLDYEDGNRVLRGRLQSVLTDERGAYRYFGLPPGRYYIAAKFEERSELFVGADAPWDQGFESAGSPTVIHRTLSTGEVVEETHELVYYGGVTDPGLAKSIDLNPGTTLAVAADVYLNAGKAASHHIRGVLINGVTGKPASGVQIRAVPQRRSPHILIPFGVTDGDGVFDLSGAVPGTYALYSVAVSADPNQAFAAFLAAGNGAPAQSPSPQISANTQIEMGNSDIDNLKLMAVPASTIAGKVEIEDRSRGEKNTDLSKVSLQFVWDPDVLGMPLTGAWWDPAATSAVLGDGAFTSQLWAGNYRVRVNGLPSNTYVKSIQMGSADVLANGLQWSGVANAPLEVVISNAAGEIEGSAVNGNLGQMANVIVALIPESLALRQRSDLYRTTQSDPTGKFHLDTIPPGDYKVFAWEYTESNSWQNVEFMKPYESSGKSVRIAEGKNAPTRVTVIPAGK